MLSTSYHDWFRSWHVSTASIVREREPWESQDLLLLQTGWPTALWSLELRKPFCFISKTCLWIRRAHRVRKGWKNQDWDTDWLHFNQACLMVCHLEQPVNFYYFSHFVFSLTRNQNILMYPFRCVAEWIRFFDYEKYILVFIFDYKCIWSIVLQNK